ncbi:hypothetical protein CPG37_02705 [Malaciobacter canalis]|uniref:Uncharacterized protein n=1 Tax=Malaciobacter canalis TaxID=1912871 RepID=A0ABX4LS14_9BACT|nr:hypothetical protein [Malaciobacter canalis]PHO10771.1 hypothetical protein CPG37_02705 [Malaciobacter canalis]QEE33928.1 hypothetical protein ACAN_2490 [Malaciobacter canalis]
MSSKSSKKLNKDIQYNGKINISISKHAIKRRKHYTPIEKDILIDLVKQIDEKYHISKRDKNSYKISHKGAIAIIKKTDDSLLLVTAYGFKRYDYKIGNIKFKVSIALSIQERKKIREDSKGIIHKIYIINFLGKKVECGSISDISKSKHSKDKKQTNEFRYKIVLDWKLFIKFENIPMKHYYLYFNNFDEISNIVHFGNDVFILNDFTRNS